MGLDVMLRRVQPVTIYEANITHNLRRMTVAAHIYEHVWRPEEIGITTAAQLVEPLKEGLQLLKSDPEKFKQFDSPNS